MLSEITPHNPMGSKPTSPWAELDSEPRDSFKPPKEPSMVMKIIWYLGLPVLALVLGGGAYLYFHTPKNFDVGVSFAKPSQVLLGEPFELTVSYSNYSNTVLENSRLVVTLPDALALVGQDPTQRTVELDTGDLGPGSVGEQKFNLIATDGSETLKHISAKLIYTVLARGKGELSGGSDVDIPIGEPALSLSFTAPEKVVSGEQFEIKVHYRNMARRDFKNVVVYLDYPPVFKFAEATQTPKEGTNEWQFSSIKKGDEGEFTIKGSAVAPEESYFTVRGVVRTDLSGQTYELAAQNARIGIAVAPLSLSLMINNDGDYIPHAGDQVHYTLAYKNNSEATIENATVSAVITGELFDFSSFRSNGSFSSLGNTATWNAGNVSALAAISPGGSGSVGFDIKLKDVFPIRRVSDKNYMLKVSGRIESPTVPPGTAASKTVSVSSIENKVAGKIALVAMGYFRDAASGILNSGPYPPRVNQKTQYTIHWKILNYATDVSDVRVTATLQSGATFAGKVKSTIGNAPTYNPSTGEVRWEIKNLAATKGVLGDPIEAIFQIEQTPALNQTNQSGLVLIGPATMTATDLFVNTQLTATAPAITTDLPDDTTITTNDRRIQQ